MPPDDVCRPAKAEGPQKWSCARSDRVAGRSGRLGACYDKGARRACARCTASHSARQHALHRTVECEAGVAWQGAHLWDAHRASSSGTRLRQARMAGHCCGERRSSDWRCYYHRLGWGHHYLLSTWMESRCQHHIPAFLSSVRLQTKPSALAIRSWSAPHCIGRGQLGTEQRHALLHR